MGLLVPLEETKPQPAEASLTGLHVSSMAVDSEVPWVN